MRTKKLLALAAVTLCCSVAFGSDWLTDGGTTTRTGWQKDDHSFTKENVKGIKLLWKTGTDEEPRALHSLMTPLVVQNVPTANGPKELIFIEGVSNDLFALEASTGKVVWKKHFDVKLPPPPPNAGVMGTEPRHFNFLRPDGSSGTPVIGPADAQGKRSLYLVDGGGVLHTIDVATGEETKPTVNLGTSKFALQLYNNQIIIASQRGIFSTKIDDPTQKVYGTVGFGGGGGLWGRRGPVITSDGTVWTTTGDGQYNLSNPNSLIIGNSVVGFHLDGDSWKVKDWFTPPNWDWLRKRDLDPNNTPTVFTYKGRELMAASGKECRVYLLDPKDMGGPDHHEPLFKTPLFCNEAVDFQNAGSWGALSSWEDASGTRWVLVPFWGPKHSQFKFPIENQPAALEGGEAAFKLVEKDSKPTLEPVWVSRDMYRGEPPIISNGLIFAYGSGENTQQAWTDIGLNFDSTIRAAKSGHVTIYILDATTGKELWSSGDQITSFSHFSGITVANGKLYMGTYDGNIYCFGLPNSK